MLARLLKLALLAELAAWGLLGYAGVTVMDMPVAAAAGVAVVLAVSARCGLVAFIYTLAGRLDAPWQGMPRLSWGHKLKAVVTEALAFTALFTFIMPFPRLWMGADRLRTASAARPPLVLVHGFRCNRALWWWLRRGLERAGWTVATLSLDPIWADIDDMAAQLARRIAQVQAATGAAQVMVVGHSMGGLVARACLRSDGGRAISRIVTLATPHRGSRLAHWGLGRNAVQMRPGNPWLEALNADPTAGLAARGVVSGAYSIYDGFVSPREYALLPGGDNRPLGSVGHLAMVLSTATLSFLLQVLAQDDAGADDAAGAGGAPTR